MSARIVTGIAAFLLTALLMLGVSLIYVKQMIDRPGPLVEAKNVIIPRGSSAHAIAEILEQNGVIENRHYFRMRYYLDGKPELKAGEYAFAAAITLHEVISEMAKGQVIPRKITVPEGLTSADTVRILNEDSSLTGTIAVTPPEGNLLPETYHYNYGDDRNLILIRMQKAMADALNDAWAARDPDLPLANPEEMLTLASIIEKETGVARERPRVAGVFINRLRKKMPLQSDPTVSYGITLGQQPLGRALTYGDLAKNSPYNTYTIRALPPGPIANPGKAALMAVAHPEKNDFIYFVADGTGGHRFAATLDEHNKNVAYWRQVQSAQPKK
jgi:UPF0755 protein